MPAFVDITGQRFGRLIAKNSNGTASDGQKTWFCVCDCGNEITAKSGNLRSGHTQSCGCFMKDRISETLSTHMQSHLRLYNVWTSMKARCYNPNSKYFHHYGGRGITMCDDWKENYQSFHDWAMGNGYDPDAPRGKCTIDRIDTNGNYCPENCRWADMVTQRHNRRERVF